MSTCMLVRVVNVNLAEGRETVRGDCSRNKCPDGSSKGWGRWQAETRKDGEAEARTSTEPAEEWTAAFPRGR
eukprot:761269-Hanusia_phi.AAC.2